MTSFEKQKLAKKKLRLGLPLHRYLYLIFLKSGMAYMEEGLKKMNDLIIYVGTWANQQQHFVKGKEDGFDLLELKEHAKSMT